MGSIQHEPVPIAMCGKFPNVAVVFAEKMLPEYEIVFHFTKTPQEAHSLLPALMAGSPNQSSTSGIGTNNNNPSPKIPKAMFVGGGNTEEDLASMMEIPEAKGIPWFGPDPEHRGEVMGGGGPEKMMEMIVARTKKCLREHGVEPGREGPFELGLWRY